LVRVKMAFERVSKPNPKINTFRRPRRSDVQSRPGAASFPLAAQGQQGDCPQSRYIVEQAFGTLRRRFSLSVLLARASYRARAKGEAQFSCQVLGF